MKENQKGITLIALIITVIVLLILAGISISLLLGNNGILTQASNATIKGREATAKEEVEMAVASARTEYMKDWTSNTSKTLGEYLTKDVLNKYLVGKGEIIEEVTYSEETGLYTLKYKSKDQGTVYTFTIDGNGEVVLVGSGSGETTGDGTDPIEEPQTEVTVTFNANGGTFSSDNETTSVRGTAGSSANLPTEPTKENAVFTGWYTAASEGTLVYDGTESSITIPETSTVVYAHWISMPEYTEMGTATAGNYSTLTAYWEYLYSDTNNIYLIHKDYLPNQYAYAPTGITKVNGGYKIYGNTSLGSTDEERCSGFVNYLTTASNWQNISKAIARDLNTITGTSNYSTANVITKGAPTLPQVQTVLNRTTHKVGYVEAQTTTVYSDESKGTIIGTMSDNVLATGWVYCNNWSSSSSTFEIFGEEYFSTSQGTKLYTSDIANKTNKAYGYWLARSFCGGLYRCVHCAQLRRCEHQRL